MATVFFLGFDGTLTTQPAYETLSSHYYASLKDNYDLDYRFASFKPRLNEVIQQAFETEPQKYFPKETLPDIKKYKMSEKTISFLNGLLNNPNNEIVIISQNRKEYILALMQYHELNINQIKIYDLKITPQEKAESIKDYITETLNDKNTVVLCENNKDDFDAMKIMLQGLMCIKNINHLITACEKPGEFNWTEIETEVNKLG